MTPDRLSRPAPRAETTVDAGASRTLLLVLGVALVLASAAALTYGLTDGPEPEAGSVPPGSVQRADTDLGMLAGGTVGLLLGLLLAFRASS